MTYEVGITKVRCIDYYGGAFWLGTLKTSNAGSGLFKYRLDSKGHTRLIRSIIDPDVNNNNRGLVSVGANRYLWLSQTGMNAKLRLIRLTDAKYNIGPAYGNVARFGDRDFADITFDGKYFYYLSNTHDAWSRSPLRDPSIVEVSSIDCATGKMKAICYIGGGRYVELDNDNNVYLLRDNGSSSDPPIHIMQLTLSIGVNYCLTTDGKYIYIVETI